MTDLIGTAISSLGLYFSFRGSRGGHTSGQQPGDYDPTYAGIAELIGILNDLNPQIFQDIRLIGRQARLQPESTSLAIERPSAEPIIRFYEGHLSPNQREAAALFLENSYHLASLTYNRSCLSSPQKERYAFLYFYDRILSYYQQQTATRGNVSYVVNEVRRTCIKMRVKFRAALMPCLNQKGVRGLLAAEKVLKKTIYKSKLGMKKPDRNEIINEAISQLHVSIRWVLEQPITDHEGTIDLVAREIRDSILLSVEKSAAEY
ncbi:MAG: hypothetical protein AAGI37_20695 [Planctomycetota bacterium]